VKRALRAEMTLRGVTYDELAERLKAIGVQDAAVNIRNKGGARQIHRRLSFSMPYGYRSPVFADHRRHGRGIARRLGNLPIQIFRQKWHIPRRGGA